MARIKIARRVGCSLPQDGKRKRVSRRVGGLVPEQARGQASRWSTQRLNDACPLACYAFGASSPDRKYVTYSELADLLHEQSEHSRRKSTGQEAD